MSDPQIPEALAPVVAGIVSLHDFRPHSMKSRPERAGITLQFQLVVPADLATIYDLKPAFAAGYTGKGQTIAVLEDSDLYNTADWTTFRRDIRIIQLHRGILKHHQSRATAWNVPIAPIRESTGTTRSDAGRRMGQRRRAGRNHRGGYLRRYHYYLRILIAAQNLINASSPPHIISMSYGFCEAETGVAANAAYNSAYQQAVAEGVSVFVAAGDEGAASCDRGFDAATHGIGVSSSASTPYNVAVGGTDFADTSQGTTSYILESSQQLNLRFGPLLYSGNPLERFLRGLRSWRFFPAIRLVMAPADIAAAVWRNNSETLHVAAGSGGPSGCATGAPAENLVVGGTLQGIRQTFLANGSDRHPERWRPRSSRCIAVRRRRSLGPLLRVLLFRSFQWRRAVRLGAPINWAGAGRNFVCFPDHGGNSGAGESEDGRRPG